MESGLAWRCTFWEGWASEDLVARITSLKAFALPWLQCDPTKVVLAMSEINNGRDIRVMVSSNEYEKPASLLKTRKRMHDSFDSHI